jgi:hypothetical protein
VNRLAQEAVIVGLARRLEDQGSWCGETHIQKATYLLHELYGIDFDFRFILYKHGPFSFELRDELGSMRADRLLERQPQPAPYGPRIVATERGRELEERFARRMERYSSSLDAIAGRLRDRGVVDLERLATAMWVTRQAPNAEVDRRARALTEVKPHVPFEDAVGAVREIDLMMGEAATQVA